MKNKVLMLYGILAPVVYVLTVILGGVIRPGYSHVAQAVSDLIATGAPNKSLLDPLFALYNILTLAFGLGLFLYVDSDKQNRGKVVGILGALVLVAEGIFGFVTLFFPEDAGGMSAAITSAGTLHIVFAGLSSLTTMLAILLMGFWFRIASACVDMACIPSSLSPPCFCRVGWPLSALPTRVPSVDSLNASRLAGSYNGCS